MVERLLKECGKINLLILLNNLSNFAKHTHTRLKMLKAKKTTLQDLRKMESDVKDMMDEVEDLRRKNYHRVDIDFRYLHFGSPAYNFYRQLFLLR